MFYKLYAQDRIGALEYLKNDLNLTRACAEKMIGELQEAK